MNHVPKYEPPRYLELKPTLIPNVTKYTIDEIKDAFYQKNQIEAFDMLCDVIKQMQKRINMCADCQPKPWPPKII